MNEEREHLAYANENGEPEECTEDCPGCHWEGNTGCEALPYGCDLCDPDDVLVPGTRAASVIREMTCDRRPVPLPLHRTEAGYSRCATCDGGGCPDCTDPA